MNPQISEFSEIMDDIKENTSDNEYKIIMDNLINLHNNNNNDNNNNNNNNNSIVKTEKANNRKKNDR